MLREGVQSFDLLSIRCNAGDKKSISVEKEKKLNKVYGSKYTIPIDQGILNHQNELIFLLRLRPASNVIKGWDPTKVTYELTDIELEYEVITNVDLANAMISNYCSRERFMYGHVNHHKTITVNRKSDSIINESINVARRSRKGLLLLSYEPCATGARDSEKKFNPDIPEVKVVVNGILNKVFSWVMKTGDM